MSAFDPKRTFEDTGSESWRGGRLGGQTLFYGERISAKSVATGLSFAAPPNQQPDVADNGERDQKPPSRSIDVVKAPRRNGESGHKQSQVTGYVDRTKSFAS